MARKMKDSGIEWIGEIPEGWELRKGKSLYRVTTGKLDANAENPDGDYPFFTCSMTPKRINSYSFDCEALLVAGNGLVGFTQYYKGKFDAYQRTYVLSDFRNVLPSFLRYYVSVGLPMEVQPKSIGSVIQFIKLGDLLNFNITLPSIEQQTIISNYLEFKIIQIDAILSKTRSSIEEYKKLKQAVITQAVTKGVRGEREMKDSGVEWIGEIPVDWEISRIKYVSIFEPSCDFRKLTPETIITYSPMECIKNGTFERRTSLYGNLAHTLTPFQNGDIVMAKVTPCFENGNIAIMNELQSGYGLGSSELFVFRPQNINTRYLFYWLQNKLFVHQACATMTGTGGLKRISPSFVKNCNIHYPSTAEQAEIADYLDAKCAEIDRLIAKKEQLVKELESYKKSLIYEVVTGKREV